MEINTTSYSPRNIQQSDIIWTVYEISDQVSIYMVSKASENDKDHHKLKNENEELKWTVKNLLML